MVQYTYDDWQAMYVGLYPKHEQIYGDVNGDGKANIEDVTELINALLRGNTAGNDAADVNDDGRVNIDDVTTLINYLLSGKH